MINIDKTVISKNFFDLIFILRHKIFRQVPLPLPLNQFCVLSLLIHENNLSLSQICDKLSIVKQQLSPIINKLEENHFIKKTISPVDKRLVIIKITPLGEKIIDDFHNKVKDSFKNNLSKLKENELISFNHSLEILALICDKIFY